MGMFCYQCQEAAKGTGCTIAGVCGKNDELANLQDLLIFSLKGLSVVALKASEKGFDITHVYNVVNEGLFATITNANFDKDAILRRIRQALSIRDSLKQNISIESNLHESVYWSPVGVDDYYIKSELVGILATSDEDVRSLRELVCYGLKGMAAYAEHAANLNFDNKEVNYFIIKALAAICDNNVGVEALINLSLETGSYGVKVMALLDKANTTTYGHPEITNVNIGVRKNPGILISGHDLKDIEELLAQTDGTGIDVYTHSEMLPAHYYPAFKKYTHFAGNYGNAWWKQRDEFESFNGPILFTTNCIVPPLNKATYKYRVFTTGSAGLEGCKHIADREKGGSKDFSEIIALAKQCKAPVEIEKGHITGGFAHNQVGLVANKVVDAVKTGAIKRFYVMAGCDGRMADRNYYTDFAKALPSDAVILTAGCAKYRYNKLPLGDIGGIPRVLDAGQCNDSYSLVVTALKLKEAFDIDDINDLPISYNIAWYEQKAVIVLLALLHLGVKNIHLGPTLPAFLSANVVKVLVANFGIAGITTVDNDLAIFTKNKAVA